MGGDAREKQKLSHEQKQFRQLRRPPPGGVGVTPYNGLYGEASPERGTIFRLQVYERVRISLVEVFERVGKSAHFGR